jgi:hypothetical protein
MNLTIPRAAPVFFAFLLLAVGATARCEEAAGVYFQHGDWEIVCDNTLTCRMAGYYPEENNDGGYGSVLITRAAGPNAPLEGEVTLADIDGPAYSALTLRINGQSKGKLKNLEDGNYALSPTQIHALLTAARKDNAVEFMGGEGAKAFTLSGKGISAVLLKADEAQGRIGTPGALIRKGDKPEENVFPPRPKPVIRAEKVSKAPPRDLTAPEIAALKPLLLQSVKGKCMFLDELEPAAEVNFTLTPLDERHVLISTLCWRGASDENFVYWVMDSALREAPKRVLPEVGWYGEGVIYSAAKGNSCWSGSSDVWDGQEFRPSSVWTTGACRFIHSGGTWHLPTFVADVINADGTPRRSEWDSE